MPAVVFPSAVWNPRCARSSAGTTAAICSRFHPLSCIVLTRRPLGADPHADAQTKMKTGTLPDGRVYLLGTQVSNTTMRHKRDPLTLSLSSDGLAFNRAWALRSNASEYRYPLPSVPESGKVYGFSYPDAVVWNGSFWASYATNKENIEVLEVPLASLM